jgi:hypothetical protein
MKTLMAEQHAANGTICRKFNYTFTEPTAEEIDYTQEGLKFKNNGTMILG